jgi:hypothetical protein
MAIDTTGYSPFPSHQKYLRAHDTGAGTGLHYPSLYEEEPGPPDFREEAASFSVSAVSRKEAAAGMANKAAGQKIITGMDSEISRFLDDDTCPTPPKLGPPHPWPLVSQIAAELNFVANNLAAGSLRTVMVSVRRFSTRTQLG